MDVDLSTILVQDAVNAMYGTLLESYQVPSTAEGVFWDFYTLSYLSTVILDHTHKAYKGSLLGDVDDVKEKLQDAEHKLLPALREQLLNGLFLSICSEIRHALEHQDIEKAVKTLSPEQHDLFMKYWRKFRIHSGSSSKIYARPRELKKPAKLSPGSDAYLNSWRAASAAIKSAGKDAADFVRVCEPLFRQRIWSTQYGGPAWAGICRGYHRLNEAKKPSELFVAIDHVFDLEHNTGSALNKSSEWSGGWLKRGLDLKFKAGIEEIVARSSLQMKSLARRVMKNAGLPLGDIEFPAKKSAAAAAAAAAPKAPAPTAPAPPEPPKTVAEHFIAIAIALAGADLGTAKAEFPPDADAMRAWLKPHLDTPQLKTAWQTGNVHAWQVTFSTKQLSIVFAADVSVANSKIFVYAASSFGKPLKLKQVYSSVKQAVHALLTASTIALKVNAPPSLFGGNGWFADFVYTLDVKIPGGIAKVKAEFPSDSVAQEVRAGLVAGVGKGQSANFQLYEVSCYTEAGDAVSIVVAAKTDQTAGYLYSVEKGSQPIKKIDAMFGMPGTAAETALSALGYARKPATPATAPTAPPSASQPAAPSASPPLHELYDKLAHAAMEYSDPGPHWTDDTVHKLEAQLKQKFPEQAAAIGEWFGDLGNLSNTLSGITDDSSEERQRQANHEYRALVRQAKTICGITS